MCQMQTKVYALIKHLKSFEQLVHRKPLALGYSYYFEYVDYILLNKVLSFLCYYNSQDFDCVIASVPIHILCNRSPNLLVGSNKVEALFLQYEKKAVYLVPQKVIQ